MMIWAGPEPYNGKNTYKRFAIETDRNNIKMDRVKIQMDLSSSGQGPVASSCEHGSDL
jgi:hypothetical protein